MLRTDVSAQAAGDRSDRRQRSDQLHTGDPGTDAHYRRESGPFTAAGGPPARLACAPATGSAGRGGRRAGGWPARNSVLLLRRL